MLCEACKAVLGQTMVLTQKNGLLDHWSAKFQYEIMLSNLEKKAEQCYSCHNMLLKLAAQQKIHTTNLSGNTILNKSYHLWVQNGRENIARLTVSAIIDGNTVVRLPLHFQRARNEVQCTSLSTGSKKTLEFVKDCLRRCHTQHKTCSSIAASERWYPTRLIEVQHDSLRLIESAETRILNPYASLSHCWGGAKILNLTTRNITALKRDIQFNLLPSTFQDAVRVSRGLGINYIWIDSLCIIQDSPEDWEREAHAMLKVYQHALCNIAAADSANSFAGLFRERDPAILASDVVNIDNGVLRGQYQLIYEHYFMQEVDDAPLNRRCWVTQERMLSRRIIHFASEQVIWDCAELTACEALPQGTEVWPNSAWGQMKIGCKQGSHFLTLPETVDQGLGQWARIVDAYSDCALTFPGDKFIAISGMAEHLRGVLNLEYCAGLWRSKLEIQLAWTVASSRREGRPRNDLAPTWSWVSINGAVKMQQVDAYQGYDIKLLAITTEVNLHEEVDKQRGGRLTGYLRMRCILNAVTIGGDSTRSYLTGEGMEHAGNLLVDSPDVIGANRLFFVPLFDLQTPDSNTDKRLVYSEIRGIIIQGVDESSGVYTRCGHALLSSKTLEDTKAFTPTFEGIKSPLGKGSFPCEDYSPTIGHLITLV